MSKARDILTDITVEQQAAAEKKLENRQKAEALMEEPEIKNLLDVYYMSIAKGDASQDSLRVYKSQMRQFFIWCVEKNRHPLQIDMDDAIKFRAELRQVGYDYKTVENKLIIVRGFYKRAAKRGKVSPAILEEFSAPKDRDALVRETHVLHPQEVDKVLDILPQDASEESLRLRVAIYLMLLQGLRVVEVHRMSIEDIKMINREVLVKGKGKNAYVYPRQDTWNELIRYIQSRKNVVRDIMGTPVFVAVGNRSKGKRLSRDSLRDMVNEVFVNAGIKQLGKSCHSFRHTYGTMLYEETGDLRLVQEELRHSKIETTTRYTHILDRHLNRPSERLNINTARKVPLEGLQDSQDNK
jgi:integrase/recombinase XerC/integrase/recombinase XerD